MSLPYRFILLLSIFFVFATSPYRSAAEDLAKDLDDDYDSPAVEVWDPIEPVNRGIFWFNDKVDRYFLEPVARGYDTVTPDGVQRGIGNFFENLKFPVHLVSDVAQFKFEQAGTHIGRFLINSTIGLAGIFDVAKEIGLKKHEEDIGTALAYHGVPDGPYIVLPFFGPSNLRDAIGLVGDTGLNGLNAIYFAEGVDSQARFVITTSATGVKVIDQRARLIEAIDTARDSSLDYYLFVREAYKQHRDGVIWDGDKKEGDEEVPPSESLDIGVREPK